jgi:hypothetical protein
MVRLVYRPTKLPLLVGPSRHRTAALLPSAEMSALPFSKATLPDPLPISFTTSGPSSSMYLDALITGAAGG